MRRRAFIASVVGVGSSATAGCLGFTLRSEDDVQRREERVENLESTAEAQRRTAEAQRRTAEAERKTAEARQETIDAQQQTISEQRTELGNRQQRIEDLNATIDRKEQRISSLESGTDGKDQRISSLESDVEALRREKVMTQYRLGYDYQEIGSNDFSTGVDNRESDWTTSMAYFSRAQGRYLSASAAFDDALTTAQDLGFSSVTGRIEESMQAAQNHAQASNSYANAAYLYVEGQTESAQDWDQQAANSFQAAEDMTIYGPDEIESNL